MPITLNDLRRFTVARSFFPPTTLKRAVDKMQFVQADPIRAPARAQDLILRQRVKDYRAGDLERRYASLDIEEDFFVVYGFVTRSLYQLMHPRTDSAEKEGTWVKRKDQVSRTQQLLDFVRERGVVHPREVDEHFAHGTVENYWGGSSNATTRLLELMHYRGLLRVARRENGIRIYSVRSDQHTLHPVTEGGDGSLVSEDAKSLSARIDALVDVAVRLYAPLPASSLTVLVSRLRYAAPQWQSELKNALQRAKQRLAQTRIDGTDWYWPTNEKPTRAVVPEVVRLLAPFDPIARDRLRFEMLWGWEYRFEAYTPAAKRKLGYYALPLLWRDQVIGWANLAVKNGALSSEFGYVGTEPREGAFKRELEAELDRIRVFLSLKN